MLILTIFKTKLKLAHGGRAPVTDYPVVFKNWSQYSMSSHVTSTSKARIFKHHAKIKLADNCSVKQPPEIPESGSQKIKKHRNSGTIFKGAIHAARSFKFSSAVRQNKPTVKCMVYSLYGYTSLTMFEARPRACVNKVRDRVWNDYNGVLSFFLPQTSAASDHSTGGLHNLARDVSTDYGDYASVLVVQGLGKMIF